MMEESKKGGDGGRKRRGRRERRGEGIGVCCLDVAGESGEEDLPKFQMAIGLEVPSFPWLASVAIMRALRDDTY